MKNPEHFLPPNAVAWLRLADGDSRFPIQAIPVGDFLIGSGSDCDMRLGDGVLPPLHSVIRVTETTASWTTMVRNPPLIVNGDTVRHSQLHDGDLVEIGPFRMTFQLVACRAEAELQALLHEESQNEFLNDAIAEMAPDELVHALQVELEQLERMDRSMLTGISDLLRVASNISNAPTFDSSSELTDTQADLNRQITEQAEKIESLSEVLQHVVQQQRLMTEVLHNLTEQISRLSQQPPRFRKAG